MFGIAEKMLRMSGYLVNHRLVFPLEEDLEATGSVLTRSQPCSRC